MGKLRECRLMADNNIFYDLAEHRQLYSDSYMTIMLCLDFEAG